MLGFGLPIWKDPRQQSTKVKKSKVDGLSFKKHHFFVNRSNSDEVTPFLGFGNEVYTSFPDRGGGMVLIFKR